MQDNAEMRRWSVLLQRDMLRPTLLQRAMLQPCAMQKLRERLVRVKL
jgi:hypothetical protein